MDRYASCPRCDVPVAMAGAVCPQCGFALIEERRAGRGMLGHVTRVSRPRRLPAARLSVAAMVLIAAFAVPPGLRALSEAFAPASEAISAAEAERHLAARYPRLRQADHAVIACPERGIAPGGQARCWILARVGLQRAVVVRLSPRGDAVEIDD